MTQYMLSVHSGSGVPDEAREPITDAQMQHSMAQINALEAEMTSAEALVLSARLTEPDTATVVREAGGEVVTTDGPFVESKEHLGRVLSHRGGRSRRCAVVGVEDDRHHRDADRGPSSAGFPRGVTGPDDVGVVTGVGAAQVGRVFREESGRSLATLIRIFGQIDLAEDAVQEAFALAVRKWPQDGLPPNPGGWITTTARNRATDRLRREARGRALLREVAMLQPVAEEQHR